MPRRGGGVGYRGGREPTSAPCPERRLHGGPARFIAEAGFATYEAALRRGTEWDRALERYPSLFDQLILAWHLDWFARRDLGRTRLSLICIGQFPGVEPFHGLGQLSPAQLASLLGTRQLVTTGRLRSATS